MSKLSPKRIHQALWSLAVAGTAAATTIEADGGTTPLWLKISIAVAAALAVGQRIPGPK